MSDDDSNNVVDLASNLTIAWLSNPNTRATAEEATGFLASIHSKLAGLSGDPSSATSGIVQNSDGPADRAVEPAVTVRKSLASQNHIISLIDGKPYATLKRHLGKHGMTPAQYRERYGLKADYPMVAPAYAEKRRQLAKKIGLGRKPGGGTKASAKGKAATSPKAAAKPKTSDAPARPRRRGRPPKAAAATK